MKFLMRFSLKALLFLGITAIVVLIIINGFISYSGISKLAYKSMPLTNLNEQVITQVREMRASEMDFLLSDLNNPDFYSGEIQEEVTIENFAQILEATEIKSKNIDAFNEHYENAKKYLDQMKGDIKGYNIPDMIALEDIEKNIDDYYNKFTLLYLKYLEKGFEDKGKIGALKATTDKINDELNKFEGSEALKNAVLILRQHEKDYFLTKNTDYHNEWLKNSNRIGLTLSTVDIDAKIRNNIQSLLGDYRSNFNEVLKIDRIISKNSDKTFDELLAMSPDELGIEAQYFVVATQLVKDLESNHQGIGKAITTESGLLVGSVIGALAILIVLSIAIGVVIPVIVIAPIKKTDKVIANIAEGDGDLTYQLDTKGKNEMNSLKKSLNKFILVIRNIVVDIQERATFVDNSVDEINVAITEGNRNIEEISHSVNEIVMDIENTSSSVEEITASIQELADSSENIKQQTESIAEKSTEVLGSVEVGSNSLEDVSASVESAKQSSEEVVDAVQTLEKYSNEIESIIDIITGISGQTSLLALNASIEAARAGEHGRGFAVVADEIRKLADESNSSTEKIVHLIEKIRGLVQLSQEKIAIESEEIMKTFDFTEKSRLEFHNIVEKMNDMSSMISVIDSLSKQQSEMSSQISQAMDGVAATTENNASSSNHIKDSVESNVAIFQQVGARINEMKESSTIMKDTVNRFKV